MQHVDSLPHSCSPVFETPKRKLSNTEVATEDAALEALNTNKNNASLTLWGRVKQWFFSAVNLIISLVKRILRIKESKKEDLPAPPQSPVTPPRTPPSIEQQQFEAEFVPIPPSNRKEEEKLSQELQPEAGPSSPPLIAPSLPASDPGILSEVHISTPLVATPADEFELSDDDCGPTEDLRIEPNLQKFVPPEIQLPEVPFSPITPLSVGDPIPYTGRSLSPAIPASPKEIASAPTTPHTPYPFAHLTFPPIKTSRPATPTLHGGGKAETPPPTGPILIKHLKRRSFDNPSNKSPDELKRELNKLQETLKNNWIEKLLKKPTHRRNQSQLWTFNRQLYQYMQRSTVFETPLSFLGGGPIAAPSTEILSGMQLEPGHYYKLSPKGVPEKCSNTDNHFHFLIRFEKGQIFLFLDGVTVGLALNVNDQHFPYKEAEGLERARYVFKEGDKVSDAFNKHLFTIGKNATIYYPNGEMYKEIELTGEGATHSDEFESRLLQSATTQKPAILNFPLKPGFFFRPLIGIKSKKNFMDLLVIDMAQDPLLQRLIEYMKAEFQMFNYNFQEKLTRIALFTEDLFCKKDYSTIGLFNNSQKSLFGNCLRGGAANHLIRSMLIKFLSDQLDLPSILFANHVVFPEGGGQTEIHSWVVFQFEEKYWLLDSEKHTLFDIENCPGETEATQEELFQFYGLEIFFKEGDEG